MLQVAWEGFSTEDEYTYEPLAKVEADEAFAEALKEFRERPAAAAAAEEEEWEEWRPALWAVGYLCDAQDQYASPWCVGKVIEVDPDDNNRVKIHFQVRPYTAADGRTAVDTVQYCTEYCTTMTTWCKRTQF